MKSLNTNQMVQLSGGGSWWKCALGITAVLAGIGLAISGVGTVIAGGAVGGGLGLINTQC